jgi:hypothetical protein
LLLGKIQEDIGRKEPEAIAFVFQIHEITCMYYNGGKKIERTSGDSTSCWWTYS